MGLEQPTLSNPVAELQNELLFINPAIVKEMGPEGMRAIATALAAIREAKIRVTQKEFRLPTEVASTPAPQVAEGQPVPQPEAAAHERTSMEIVNAFCTQLDRLAQRQPLLAGEINMIKLRLQGAIQGIRFSIADIRSRAQQEGVAFPSADAIIQHSDTIRDCLPGDTLPLIYRDAVDAGFNMSLTPETLARMVQMVGANSATLTEPPSSLPRYATRAEVPNDITSFVIDNGKGHTEVYDGVDGRAPDDLSVCLFKSLNALGKETQVGVSVVFPPGFKAALVESIMQELGQKP